MPLHRRLPKRGFSNERFRDTIVNVNVSDLEAKFEAGAEVNEESLRQAGLVRGQFDGIKVLSDGEISKAVTLKGLKASASAKAKIEAAGGSFAE